MTMLSLAAQAYDALEHRIVAGELPPGSLLSEQRLSREVGIGRTPVREALQRLARDQLVRIVARRGAIVQDVERCRYTEAAEMRRAIEPPIWQAAALDAKRADRMELAAIASALERPEAIGDTLALLRLDARCHRLIAAIGGNRLLVPSLPALHGTARRALARAGPERAEVLVAYAGALRAVAAGDAPMARDLCGRALLAVDQLAASTFDQDDPNRSSLRQDAAEEPGAGLSEKALREIERRIVAGRWKPGEVLSEMRLSEEIGIGRTPVREALQRLASYRLVSIRPRRGVAVADDQDDDLVTLFGARHALEGLLSCLAARRAEPAERQRLGELGEAWIRAAREGDTPAIIEMDDLAKRLLRRMARNSFLADAHAPVHALARRLYFRRIPTKPDVDVAVAHAELLRAVASGNEREAALAAIRCLAESRRAITEAGGQA